MKDDVDKRDLENNKKVPQPGLKGDQFECMHTDKDLLRGQHYEGSSHNFSITPPPQGGDRGDKI